MEVLMDPIEEDVLIGIPMMLARSCVTAAEIVLRWRETTSNCEAMTAIAAVRLALRPDMDLKNVFLAERTF